MTPAGSKYIISLFFEQPHFWMNEVSGQLHSAVEAYLHGDSMESWQIAYCRSYIRQWINPDVWGDDDEINELRRRVDELTSREAISAWLATALDMGIDPL